MTHYFLALTCIILAFSCTRDKIPQPNEILRKTTDFSFEYEDTHDLSELPKGVQSTVTALTETPDSEVRIGSETLSKDRYIGFLNQLKGIFSQSKSWSDIVQNLSGTIDVYEVYGNKSWGDIFLTSYFVPEIEGSRRKTKEYSQPIYKVPQDIVEIPFHEFPNRIPQNERYLMGRITKEKSIRGHTIIAPYYSREEIDSQGALKGRGLEIAWANPVDVFFLHIQGSGVIRFKDNSSVRVGFIDGVLKQNGHRYIPIGKYLTDVIPLDEMTMEKIEDHLHSLPSHEAQAIMNKNPSYIFYDVLKDESITYMGTPTIAGRTIATDQKYFPKGGVGYLVFDSPVMVKDPLTGEEKTEWVKTGRIVFDHDIGGAISGPGRADLFWGSGREAGRMAGQIKQEAKLYYFLPKN